MKPDLGTCCICRGTRGVHHAVFLSERCEIPGHGWGCVACELPPDGALAVLCGDCQRRYWQDGAELVEVCRGYPAAEGRAPYRRRKGGAFAVEWFGHDLARHQVDRAVVRIELSNLARQVAAQGDEFAGANARELADLVVQFLAYEG